MSLSYNSFPLITPVDRRRLYTNFEASLPATVLPEGGGEGPSILACSISRQMSREHMDLLYSRKLCEDRKGVFEHLAPKRLVKSVS